MLFYKKHSLDIFIPVSDGCGKARKFNKSTTQFAIFKPGIFYTRVFCHIKTQWKLGS